MGTFRVRVEVGDPAGERYEAVEAVVDSGATYTALPATLLRGFGVVPHARATFVLADGRQVEREIAAPGSGWTDAPSSPLSSSAHPAVSRCSGHTRSKGCGSRPIRWAGG